MINLDGLGPDQPTITNASGATQSDIPYRCDLLDGRAILAMAKVLSQGANKYGVNNWRSIPCNEHINHAMAHVFAFLGNDKQDDHLEHAFCRMMMAVATKPCEAGDS
jgi:hypothetical protein